MSVNWMLFFLTVRLVQATGNSDLHLELLAPVVCGEETTLTCKAKHNISMNKTCGWSRNNTPIISSGALVHNSSADKYSVRLKDNSCFLIIRNVTVIVQGEFRCDVGFNSVSNPFNFTCTNSRLSIERFGYCGEVSKLLCNNFNIPHSNQSCIWYSKNGLIARNGQARTNSQPTSNKYTVEIINNTCFLVINNTDLPDETLFKCGNENEISPFLNSECVIEPPTNINVKNIQKSSAVVSWDRHYPARFNETFVIQIRREHEEWKNVSIVNSSKDKSSRLSERLSDLGQSSTYYIRMFTIGVNWTSNYTEIFTFTTTGKDGASTPKNLIIFVTGGGALFSLLVGIIVSFVRHYSKGLNSYITPVSGDSVHHTQNISANMYQYSNANANEACRDGHFDLTNSVHDERDELDRTGYLSTISDNNIYTNTQDIKDSLTTFKTTSATVSLNIPNGDNNTVNNPLPPQRKKRSECTNVQKHVRQGLNYTQVEFAEQPKKNQNRTNNVRNVQYVEIDASIFESPSGGIAQGW